MVRGWLNKTIEVQDSIVIVVDGRLYYIKTVAFLVVYYY